MDEEAATSSSPLLGPSMQSGNCFSAVATDSTSEGPLYRLTTCYSDLQRAVKSAGWLLRMKTFFRSRSARVVSPFPMGPIDGDEYNNALLALIRLSQQQTFPNLLQALEISAWHEIMAGKHGSSAKLELQPLQKFCPMMEDGVIRIGGRLQHSHLPLDFKHPIVLPKRNHVTGLVILYTYRKGGHNAAQYVLNTLRERFYVIGQGRTVKYYIKKDCLICRYQHAKPGTQLMAPLPPARVEAGNKTFETCGVDYMGPLEVRQDRNQLKRYCCVFTCLASRATHLEMAYDLTTESFLMALRRFLSIRGHSTRTIHSDNGTNFVGARQELVRGVQRLNQQKIINELSPQGIKWVHAPPLASHQGGIYEAVIRLVRKTMASLMAERHLRTLTDEGLVTLLKEVEYILNCRPLTPVSTDPDAFEALSPIMLLTGSIGPGLPPDVFVKSDGLRSSWRACQLQADEFWRRWQVEYLSLLQGRSKWLVPGKNVNKGDLVLLLDQDQPRNTWPKAIIDEVYPGRDGMVRSVKVRTADRKTYIRDVRKLCNLEGDL